MKYLILCQIGPVQTFIAAGRRTDDLLAGSKLLSHLASVGVEAARQAGAEMIFPTDVSVDAEQASVPHRFAFVTEYEPGSVANHVHDVLLTAWRDVANTVRDQLIKRKFGSDGDWLRAFDRPEVRDGWLEFYWVAVDYESETHGDAMKAVNAAMRARRNLRTFPQINEDGWKCTQTGASSALPIPPAQAGDNYATMRSAWRDFGATFDDEGKMIRPSEMLGTVALIKRLIRHTRAIPLSDKPFPSTRHIAGIGDNDIETEGREVEGYFAVLHMDGDRMGALFGALDDAEQHRLISGTLDAFAREQVPAIIQRYNADPDLPGRARLVYAGGDDVLALMPVRVAIACADEIRRAFVAALHPVIPANLARVLEEAGGMPTMSAGIAIVPENYPLDMALELSRSAEHKAKHVFGRNACALIEAAGGSLTRISGGRWALDVDETLTLRGLTATLISRFQGDSPDLSAKLGYDLHETVVYALTPAGMEGARTDEVRRLLKRRANEALDRDDQKAMIDALTPLLVQWGEHPSFGWESLANWLILARFLASDGKVRQ